MGGCVSTVTAGGWGELDFPSLDGVGGWVVLSIAVVDGFIGCGCCCIIMSPSKMACSGSWMGELEGRHAGMGSCTGERGDRDGLTTPGAPVAVAAASSTGVSAWETTGIIIDRSGGCGNILGTSAAEPRFRLCLFASLVAESLRFSVASLAVVPTALDRAVALPFLALRLAAFFFGLLFFAFAFADLDAGFFRVRFFGGLARFVGLFLGFAVGVLRRVFACGLRDGFLTFFLWPPPALPFLPLPVGDVLGLFFPVVLHVCVDADIFFFFFLPVGDMLFLRFFVPAVPVVTAGEGFFFLSVDFLFFVLLVDSFFLLVSLPFATVLLLTVLLLTGTSTC